MMSLAQDSCPFAESRARARHIDGAAASTRTRAREGPVGEQAVKRPRAAPGVAHRLRRR